MKTAQPVFKVNAKTGLIEPNNFKPSPHHDERPDQDNIDLIVIHGISLPPNEFGTGAIEAFFCGTLNTDLHPYYKTIADLKVSSHLLIKRDGEIVQFVPFNKRAWHAGVSQFRDKSRCNDFSIGIELEGADDIAYEPIQYQQLATVILQLQDVYPAITKDRIVGHSDIAPGRKTDPGPAFNWSYLKGLLG